MATKPRRTEDEEYEGFGTEPIEVTPPWTPYGRSGHATVDEYVRECAEHARYADHHYVSLATMKRLGFVKVKWCCVYRGPVERLVEELRRLGWRNADHPNPFLLVHPEAPYHFNYAESAERASKKYISFFRG